MKTQTRTLVLLLFQLTIMMIMATAKAQAQAQNQPNDYNNQNLNQFNPSFAIIIVILVAALFLMAFFSIYIRHCAESPATNGTVLPSARSRRGPRGLDPAVIQTFPILEYSEAKTHKIGKESLECAVCLCEFEDTETLRLIPKCDHVFHPDCIDEWLSSHTTCPVCRANLAPSDSLHDSRTPSSDRLSDVVVIEPAPEPQADRLPEAEVLPLPKTLNRNRTRGSRSNRPRRFPFLRSHSTGHSWIQQGENTERFTLRLPLDVRNQIINRQLQRASSLIVLPREGSSRGKRLSRSLRSDRWLFGMAPPFFSRALSIRSPKVRNTHGEGASTSSAAPILPPTAVDSARPPV